MERVQPPPWGSLPLERYVVSKWTSSTETDPDERRRLLAREFTEIGDVGRASYLSNPNGRPASGLLDQSEWQAILSPLRTDLQRYMALPSAFQPQGFEGFGILWLRTCYDQGSDALHDDLLSGLNTDVALEVEQNLLDDRALYDYGNDWTRVFNVFPERLFNMMLGNEEGTLDVANERDATVRELQSKFAADDFDAYTIEEASRRQLPGEDRLLTEEEVNANIYRAKTARLHDRSIANYLYVADKTALESGKALVVFFDDCGRVIRQGRLRPDACENIAGAWPEGLILEAVEFTEADVGPDYLPGGICGPPYSSS